MALGGTLFDYFLSTFIEGFHTNQVPNIIGGLNGKATNEIWFDPHLLKRV